MKRFHQTRYIPDGARLFTRTEGTDAVIYCYEVKRSRTDPQLISYGLIYYHGTKATTPDGNYIYRTAKQRADEIASFIKGRKSHADYIADRHKDGRPLTQAAKAAAQIKAKLKDAGINASVRSKNFSMGNDVNIDLVDAPPWIFKKAEKIAAPYEMGHFDGMTDMYEYSNSRDDIPQAKYIFVNNQMTDAMRDRVYAFLRANFADGNDLPENRKEAESVRFMDTWVSDWIYRLFRDEQGAYWQGQRPQLKAVG